MFASSANLHHAVCRIELHGKGFPMVLRYLRPPNVLSLSRHVPSRASQIDTRIYTKHEGRKPRASERHVVGCCEEFYESDCQGRFSSLLIAFSSLPVQSALSVPMGTIASASGWAEQSFSAGSYQYTPSILIQTIASDSVITTDGVNHGSI